MRKLQKTWFSKGDFFAIGPSYLGQVKHWRYFTSSYQIETRVKLRELDRLVVKPEQIFSYFLRCISPQHF